MTEYKQTLTIVSASPIEVTTKPDDRSWRDPLEGHRSTQTLLVYDRVASTRQKLDLIDERLYPVEYHDLDADGVTVFEDMKSLTSWLSDVMFPEDKSDPFHPYPWTWINGAQSLQRSVDSWKVASPPGQPIPDHLTIELVTALSKYSPVLEFTQIVDDLEGTPIELPYWRGGLPLRPNRS